MLGAVLRRCGLLWAGLGAVGARQYPDCPAGGPALRAAQPQPLRVVSYNFYLCVQLPPAYFGVGLPFRAGNRPLMSSPFHSLALRRTAIKDAARREERWPAAILDTGGEFDVRRMFQSEPPLINLDGAAQASLGAAPAGRGRQSCE